MSAPATETTPRNHRAFRDETPPDLLAALEVRGTRCRSTIGLFADEEPGRLRNLLDVLGTGAFGLLLPLRQVAYRMTEAGFNTP